jgi:hypothetical protein
MQDLGGAGNLPALVSAAHDADVPEVSIQQTRAENRLQTRCNPKPN